MQVWKGSTSTTMTQYTPKPVKIEYFIITNKSGYDITLNITVQRNLVSTNIAPYRLQLGPGESYTDENILLLQDEFLQLYTTGLIDYYFSMPQG